MKTDEQLFPELRAIYLFESLNDAQLTQVIKSARELELVPKQTLFEFRQPAEHFYLVRSGRVKLFTISENGDEKVMEIISPGKTFAEAIMFLEKHIYPVHAAALSHSSLISFDMHTFRSILRDSTETCFQLMAGMSRRLHQRIDEISNLSLHNSTYRLVVFLLEQIPDDVVALPQIHLDIPKSVIASRLSIQPETLSRILARLTREGLITVKGNDIIMHDITGLRSLL